MKERVVLVLAGDLLDVSWIKPWLAESELILSADGGADWVRLAGFRPDYLVGDLDSVSIQGRDNAKQVVGMADQNSSDCEKLLAFATELGIESAVVVGASGRRVDHMLGTIQAVARWPGSATVAYERQLLRILRGPCAASFLGEGIISALPLTACSAVSMENVQWPLNGVEMSADGFSSLSNFSYGSARVSVESGVLAVFSAYDGKPDWRSNEAA